LNSRSLSLEAVRTQKSFWPHNLFFGLLIFLLPLQAAIWWLYLPLGLVGRADFRQLYTGGYMVRTGHAQELYDFEAQQRFQNQLFPKTASEIRLLITHPAFEELLFVPLSRLPYRAAFWIFLGMNCALVWLSLELLKPKLAVLTGHSRWFPLMLVASFFPISRTIQQGQDSILLLTLLAGAYVMLDQERFWWAGFLVGCGAFRYQIVVPIALLYLLWQNWKFVRGFLTSAGIAALVSVAVVGIKGTIMYVQYMHAISLGMISEADMMRYANSPRCMLNLRGLISAILWERAPHWTSEVLILVASLAVIVLAARMKPSFPLAVLAASLVSYHFLAHDASVWLIPIIAASSGGWALDAFLAVLMLVAPFSGAAIWEGINSHAFLAAIPAVLLFAVWTMRARTRLSPATPSRWSRTARRRP
jgi:hypothetical protein